MDENQTNAWMQILWLKKNKIHASASQKKIFEIKEYQLKKNIYNKEIPSCTKGTRGYFNWF